MTVGGSAALQAELAITLPARIAPERALQRAQSEHTLRAPAAPPLTEPMPERHDPVDSSDGSGFWWWAAGAAVVAAAVVTVVLVSPSSGQAEPVQGDTNPPLVRGRVR